MALERILARLRLGAGVEPLDRDAALDAAAGVAGILGHACDGTGHELEGALALLPRFDLELVGRGLGALRGEEG